tara:strand:+ start:341 stop:1174 length:834 start_codon:yes stop_codon:yes gene_type:complete
VPKDQYKRSALKQTFIAIEKKALIQLNTELVQINKIESHDFVFRYLKTKEPEHIKPLYPNHNPFMPWDKNLEIAEINDKHMLILNKYPVQFGHMLLITKQWVPQTNWLDESDFKAIKTVDQDTQGLWFYNSGREAGASQEHRHIQLLPRNTNELYCPRNDWFKKNIDQNNQHLFNKSIFIKKRLLNSDIYNIYLELSQKACLGNPKKDLRPNTPYNFIISKEWIALIRRLKDITYGFNLNGLAFAGYILITKESDIAWVRKNGAEKLISNVISPIDS